MAESWIDPVIWVVLGAISLGALATGIGLILKAFSFQDHYALSGFVCLGGTVALTTGGLLLPLLILSGQQYQQNHLLADLLMLGISGLGLIGMICFIIDHLMERPNFLMLAAAACFAILIVPWIYIAYAKEFNEVFQIAIIRPESITPTGLDPLDGERGSLGETEEVTTDVATEAPNDSTEEEENGSNAIFNSLGIDEPTRLDSSLAEPSESEAPTPNFKSQKDWLYDDP